MIFMSIEKRDYFWLGIFITDYSMISNELKDYLDLKKRCYVQLKLVDLLLLKFSCANSLSPNQITILFYDVKQIKLPTKYYFLTCAVAKIGVYYSEMFEKTH